jgi:hypothetical protein
MYETAMNSPASQKGTEGASEVSRPRRTIALTAAAQR